VGGSRGHRRATPSSAAECDLSEEVPRAKPSQLDAVGGHDRTPVREDEELVACGAFSHESRARVIGPVFESARELVALL
jgi:hypothetical protein